MGGGPQSGVGAEPRERAVRADSLMPSKEVGSAPTGLPPAWCPVLVEERQPGPGSRRAALAVVRTSGFIFGDRTLLECLKLGSDLI